MAAARHEASAWLALVCLTLASCALVTPPPPQIDHNALLNQVPRALPHGDRRTVIVLVLPPETTAIYDTKRMAYMTRPHEVSYFNQREWGETPSEMLHPLLVDTLENTGSFAAVVVPPYTTRYTYALRTAILELRQDFTSRTPTLELSLRFRLTDGAGRIVATKVVSLREPMRQADSYAGVVAANEATARALQEMAAFVVHSAG